MIDVKTQTLFNTISTVYDAAIPKHILNHYCNRRAEVLRNLMLGGWTCSIGGGTGNLEQLLQEENDMVVLVDFSFGMCATALRKGIRHVICADATALPLKTGSVSLCFSVATFHHLLIKERVVNTIHEMFRITGRSGHMVIWDHNPLNPWWRILMKRVPQDRAGTRLVGKNEIAAVLRSLEGTVRHFRGGWIPEFIPAVILPLAIRVESFLERIPFVKIFSAHNIFLIKKRNGIDA